MKLSKNYIISIRKFVSNYLNLNYLSDKKLTHDILFDYLSIKNIKLPRKLYYKNVNNSDILMGKTLIVCDECNKIVCYENPVFFNSLSLLKELKKTRKIESKEILEDTYTIEHSNRIKVLCNKRYSRRNKNVKY